MLVGIPKKRLHDQRRDALTAERLRLAVWMMVSERNDPQRMYSSRLPRLAAATICLAHWRISLRCCTEARRAAQAANRFSRTLRVWMTSRCSPDRDVETRSPRRGCWTIRIAWRSCGQQCSRAQASGPCQCALPAPPPRWGFPGSSCMVDSMVSIARRRARSAARALHRRQSLGFVAAALHAAGDFWKLASKSVLFVAIVSQEQRWHGVLIILIRYLEYTMGLAPVQPNDKTSSSGSFLLSRGITEHVLASLNSCWMSPRK